MLHPSSSSTVVERSIRLVDEALDVVLDALVSTIELRSPALLTPLLLLLLPAVLLLYSHDEQEEAGRRDLVVVQKRQEENETTEFNRPTGPESTKPPTARPRNKR